MQPGHPPATAGLARADRLDSALALVDTAHRDEQAGRLDAAEAGYRKALATDAAAPGAQAGLDRLLARRNADAFSVAMSRGFADAAAGRINAARAAFNQAMAGVEALLVATPEEIVTKNEIALTEIARKNAAGSPSEAVRVSDMVTGHKYDAAFPLLMKRLVFQHPGIRAFVLAALLGAVISSLAAVLNAASTMFTMDLYRAMKPQTEQKTLVTVGRIVAVASIVIAIFITKPFLQNFGQGFQYIQNFTGFVTPGICVIFLLGLFWARTTATAAMVSMLATVVLSYVFYKFLPDYPFMNRVGWCFVAGIVIAVGISLMSPQKEAAMSVDIKNVDFRTGTGFNIAALVVIAILAWLYIMWW